jgi:integrase
MKPTEPMTLTKDAVTKLALPPGKTEHTVWDHAIAGFGIRLREHSATYFFRYRHGKRQPRITIGAVSAITNAKARAKAAELYARAKLAEDPAGARTEARKRANETFALALKPYLIRRQVEMRKRSFINLNRHLMKHAAPLHRLELAKAAERRRMAELLTKIASDSGPVEANAVKGSLNKFFGWAIGQGLLDGTGIDIAPTVAMANQAINGPRTHVPSDAEVVKIWGALDDGDYSSIIRLLVLTLCRRNEIGHLVWDEVDFDAGVIRLPAERTKTGEARDVPMSQPVRDILWRRYQQRDPSRPLVFGTGEGGFQGWARAKQNLDVRAGVSGWVHHDLRRYGSTTMNNESIATPWITDAALGHAVVKYVTEQGQVISAQSAERGYNYATYSQQVRTAMELWGQRVMQLVAGERKPAKVVSLRRRKGA